MNQVTFLAFLAAQPQVHSGDIVSATAYTMVEGRDALEPITIKAWRKSAEALSGWQPGMSVFGTGSIRQHGAENDYAFEVWANSLTPINASVASSEGPQAIYKFQVCLAGNLGKDPELKYFESGKCKAQGSIALSRGKTSPTDWVKWEAWGKTAELISNYCVKGSKIGVIGRLKVDRWKDSPVLVAIADRVEFLGGKGDRQPSTQTAPVSPIQQAVTPVYQPTAVAPVAEYDEIPF